MASIQRDKAKRLRGALGASLLGIAGACGGLTLPVASVHAEQAAVRSFDIEGGSLAEVLGRFASAAGAAISFDSRSLQGRSSSGIKGQFGTAQGFAQLLSGSGFKAELQGNGSYRLVPLATSGSTLELDATSIQAMGLGSETENTGSYTTGAVTMGGKTPQALREIPQSVSVITRQRIEDQGLTNLTEVLNQATGITLVGGNDADVQIFSRGYEITNVQTDGGAPTLREQSYETLPDMIRYDHVEVLRGADGLFSGTGEPGGSVNLVRKRALAEPQLKVATSAGSWSNYRQEVDVTGPMGFDGHLRGRLAAAYQDREYFWDTTQSEKQVYYGVLEADITPDTLLSVGGSHEWRDVDGYWDNGMPRYSTGGDLGLSRDRSLVADWSSNNYKSTEGFVKLEHQFNEQWKANASYTHTEFRTRMDLGQSSGALNPDTGTTNFVRTVRAFDNVQELFNANLMGKFQAFGLEHELLVGGDYENIHRDYADSSLGSPATPIDPFSTDVSDQPKPLRPSLYYEYPSWDTRKSAGYVTLRARLSEPLKLVIGARYSDYDDVQVSNMPAYNLRFVTGGKDTGVVTPYGGLVYDLGDNWSVYGSYAQIYKPQTSYLDVNFKPLEPITGNTYELGVKGEFYEGRLNFSSALYYIKREHEFMPVLVQDTEGNNCCYVAGSKSVSRGFDSELSGEVLPGWQVAAGYTFNLNEQRKAADSANVGAPVSSQTPKHLFKLFSSYQLPGEFNRWKVGVGVVAQSSNYRSGTVSQRLQDGSLSRPTSPFSFSQAGYAVWNGLVEYRIDEHWTAAVNANNLFDKHYYQTVYSSTRGNWYGEPRNYMLTVRGSF